MTSALAALGAGCSGADDDGAGEEQLGAVDLASVKSDWTRFISEEDGQCDTCGARCPSNTVAIGFECGGSYCDNVRLRCEPFKGLGSSRPWSRWVEHDGLANVSCAADEWVVGVRCWGDNCDNLAILCAGSTSTTRVASDCEWSGWFSEESGAFGVPEGLWIKGVECSGTHCDNVRVQYCAARPPSAQSCSGHCGSRSADASCYCDEACLSFGDCCNDKQRICD